MDCRIILNNSGGIYGPSETINGNVVIDLPTEENIRNLLCTFMGKEETKWTSHENIYDQRTNTSRSGIVQYKGENLLLSMDILLTAGNVFPAGRHEFPFAIHLPRKIPSTYISDFGSIQYTLKAILDTGPQNNREDKISIHVKSPINFNDIRSELQLEPIVYQNEEVIWHCCYAGDPVTMDLILEKEAYVLDEAIPIKLDVNNKSNEEISEINVSFVLVVEMSAVSPKVGRKYCEKLLRGAKAPGLSSGRKNIYSFRFQIPPDTEIPNFTGSLLFRQKCVLKAESKILDSDTQLDVQTEIKLGHIPVDTSRRIRHPHGPVRRVHSSGAINRPLGFNFFHSQNSATASAPPSENNPSAPSRTTDDIDSLPPSYEEAVRTTFSRKPKKE